MNAIEKDLENILQAEITVYEDILLLEEEKARAIMSKDGKMIEELSIRQESLIKEIDLLENDRIDASERCGRRVLSAETANPTLKEIAGTMDHASSQSLLKTGDSLKRLLYMISEKQGVNARMIQDNIDFFNLLISDLKNSSSIKAGYNRDGSENTRIVNPVLFNIRA